MALVKPSREQYKPEDDLKVAGSYVAQCTRIEQGLPYPAWPDKTRVAIEFTVDDTRTPQQKGKKVAIVVPESIFDGKGKRPDSLFLQYCRAMGGIQPERGCDPDQFLHKWYLVTAVQHGERCVVRAVVPLPGQMTNTGPSTTPSLPPEGKPIEHDGCVPF